MEEVLRQCRFERLIPVFQRENISPNLVCKLSSFELQCLGVSNSQEMMKLRTYCIKYSNVQPDRLRRGEAGPPVYEIPKEIIASLIETGFKISEIAKLLSVSESTVYRRMRMYNISKVNFTDINDNELQREINDLLTNFPRCGENMLQQMLKQKDIWIPRSRLRENLCKLDEDGIAERKRGRLHRRVYNVQAPNHLWHVDTNHKLIRWRFIILGGVDGFSRLVTFLKCENNNKAETVYKSFMDGVKAYGMPLRVRSDQGRENILIADYMLATRGPGSMITGKSVHNQRIERLWRDVYEGVLSLHYDLFYFMEDQHLLDILNPVHIYALHYVYLPKINEKLNIWQEAWSRHKLRTVKTSPLCLWTAGNINNLITFQLDDPANYGVDGTIDDNEIENNHERADLNPRPIFSSEIIPVSERCQEQLILHCPSDWTSSNYGIDIYCTALDIIKRY